jgi:hypothetical protein
MTALLTAPVEVDEDGSIKTTVPPIKADDEEVLIMEGL